MPRPYLTGEDARDLGVLLEVNRRLLHPVGLMLETAVPTDGTQVCDIVVGERGVEAIRDLAREARDRGFLPSSWSRDLDCLLDEALSAKGSGVFRIRDARDDPEGVVLPAGDQAEPARLERAQAFARMWSDREPARTAALGFMVQPVVPEFE